MRRIGTPNGLFNVGDPATNTKGTVVTADWLNAIQEELAAVVEGLGGTLNPADGNQIFDWLLASFANISGNASQLFNAATPAQFDASSKVATMAALQRALGSRADYVAYATSQTLSAAHIGKTVAATSASPTTFTLSAIAGRPAGSAIRIANTSSGVLSVVPDAIGFYAADSTPLANVQLGAGDWIDVVFNGASWIVEDGSTALKYSASFGSSLTANGYQKLPSGLIHQWGTTGNIAGNGGTAVVTLPLASPTVAPVVTVTPSYSGTGACYMQVTNRTATGFTINNSSPTTAAALWSAESY